MQVTVTFMFDFVLFYICNYKLQFQMIKTQCSELGFHLKNELNYEIERQTETVQYSQVLKMQVLHVNMLCIYHSFYMDVLLEPVFYTFMQTQFIAML